MSVFDDNILDKVPEDAIWDWLNTNMSIFMIENVFFSYQLSN